MQSVDMKKWKQIWESKQADEKTLSADSLEAVFMELKRIDGNDTIERGGGSIQRVQEAVPVHGKEHAGRA